MKIFSKITLLFALLFITGKSIAQVSINATGAAPDSKAMLDVSSTSKGLLMPRMTSLQRTGIFIPPLSLTVFDTDTKTYWYHNGTVWVNMGAGAAGSDWSLTGNGGTNPASNFLGTTDLQPLKFRLNNLPFGGFYPTTGTYLVGSEMRPYNKGYDILLGYNVGAALTRTMGSHIALGYHAMKNAVDAAQGAIAIGDSTLMNNTIGSNQNIGQGINNIAIGMRALQNNTIGARNVAIGHTALVQNTSGWHNTAIGAFSMQNNQNGVRNTALGTESLISNVNGSENISLGVYNMIKNTSGSMNIAIGNRALQENIDKSGLIAIGDSALLNNGLGATSPEHSINNVAIGKNALQQNTSGFRNTALGFETLKANTNGDDNTAIGANSLKANIFGRDNTALGHSSLMANTAGEHNVALGESAMKLNVLGIRNTAVGSYALEQNMVGSYNTAVGFQASYYNNNNTGNIALGAKALFRNSRSNIVAVGDSALANNGFGIADQSLGNYNTAVGSKVLFANTAGHKNTAVGYRAMINSTTGAYNTALGVNALSNNNNINNIAIGPEALLNDNSGEGNIAIGSASMIGREGGLFNVGIGGGALYQNDGNRNIAIGVQTGFTNLSGSNNTFIGHNAGYFETGSNKLYIEPSNANSANALIFGDFAADSLRINGKFSTRNNAVVQGFTKLGGYGNDVPAVKMRKLSGVFSANSNTNGTPTLIPHFVANASKIIAINVLGQYAGSGGYVSNSFLTSAGFQFDYQVDGANIIVTPKQGNSISLVNQNIKILITYEE